MVLCGGVCALSGVNLSLTANGYKAVPLPFLVAGNGQGQIF